MTEGYVYRWTDSSNGKKYIGSHNGAKKHYKGSGVRFQHAYKKRPECFTREILYTGPDYLELEGFILETVDAKNDDSYYNLSNESLGCGSGKDHPMYGQKHTEESKKRISDFNRGRKHTEESRKKRSESLGIKVKELSTGLVFNSVTECGQYFNLRRGTISKHLKNKRPIVKGPNKGKHFIYNE